MACSCWKRGLVFVVVSGAVLAVLIAHFSPTLDSIHPPDNTYWGPEVLQQGELSNSRPVLARKTAILES